MVQILFIIGRARVEVVPIGKEVIDVEQVVAKGEWVFAILLELP
jgi:hypothetical protein